MAQGQNKLAAMARDAVITHINGNKGDARAVYRALDAKDHAQFLLFAYERCILTEQTDTFHDFLFSMTLA